MVVVSNPESLGDRGIVFNELREVKTGIGNRGGGARTASLAIEAE